MAFSPNGKKLTCGTDDDIRIYNINNSQLTLGLLRGHKGLVHSVLWSCSGSRLFSGSWDYMICCWNSNTGEQIGQPWTGHTNWICSLCLSPDRLILASASLDKTACFWDASSGQPIGQHLHISRFRFCNRHIVAKIMTAFDTVIHSYSGFYILHHSQSHYIMGWQPHNIIVISVSKDPIATHSSISIDIQAWQGLRSSEDIMSQVDNWTSHRCDRAHNDYAMADCCTQ